MSYTKIETYLDRNKDLPGGTQLWYPSASGKLLVAGNGLVQEVQGSEEFISEGNRAKYWIGSPETSSENPENATVKFGITEPHGHFAPHAHGTKHLVTSHGFSRCIFVDHAQKKARIANLIPRSTLDIPAWVSHMFLNPSDCPLVELIANAGYGIHHEKYAITREIAQNLLSKESDPTKKEALAQLIDELELIGTYFNTEHPERSLMIKEWISEKLYRLAEYIGASQ